MDSIDLSDVELTQNHVFITSIFELKLGSPEQRERLNQQLLQEIFAIREAGEKGLDYALAGWQTPHDLQERPAFAPFFAALQEILLEICRAEGIPEDQPPVVARAWSNIQKKGEFVSTHIHPWSVLSGVYYVQTAPDCGDLHFEDPRPGHVAVVSPQVTGRSRVSQNFSPEAGSMVIFPSWLQHYTDPNRSGIERICIAFNVSLCGARMTPELGY